MAEMTAYEPGVPSWVDLGTPDVSKAAAFYGAVFGWELADQGPEAGGYGFFTLGGRNVAGVGPLQGEGQPSAWSTYISTDDVDGALTRVQAEGGTVFVPAMDVMEAGRMAIAADPTGAVFGIWQPGRHKGADLVNEPNTLCWNELATRDTDRAAAFYQGVFGWKADTQAFGESTYTQFQVSDRTIAGMMPMGENFPAEVPPNWLTYFAVADCDSAVAAAEGGGGSVVTPAIDMSVGRFAVLADPAGAVFAVIQMAEEPS
jgi:predicted enzyme related to lactoylglutathione lyase